MLECQAMIEPQAQQSNIQISFPQYEATCYVNADRTRLKQVLINLLSNAIKYNRAGGTVVVSSAPSSFGRIQISVEDTGEGLSEEKLAQLFQQFNRLGQQGGSDQGTGIGLVVTKRLVEQMGGTINVESKVTKGSKFWIELDLAEAPHHVADRAEPTLVVQSEVEEDAPLRDRPDSPDRERGCGRARAPARPRARRLRRGT